MKGTSFQNGVEFKVTIDGESWPQGATLSGTIEAVVRNAGAVTPSLQVVLADATEKKVKAKKEDAFQVLEKSAFEKSPSSWKFNLPIDARVTDKAGNLYLLYGNGDAQDLHTLGQLKLNIIPHLHLQDFLEVLKIHYRFVPKTITAGKKNTVDVKFDAPDGKDWASLESLTVSLKMMETAFHADFQFVRTEIDATKPGTSGKTTKREFEADFDLTTFIHDFNQRLNKDAVQGVIDQVIAEYRSAGWLS